MATKSYTTEEAIAQGQADAKANHEKEKVNGSTGATTEEIVKDAQDTAKFNHEVDVKNQEKVEDNSNELTNDTSKTAKVATAKSQLEPAGVDNPRPVSKKEIKDSALEANMETGNKTGLSNEEAANQALEATEEEEVVEDTEEEEPK